jgi:glutathione synthase/RimK-type ligase-like ATP-grasp enzyme
MIVAIQPDDYTNPKTPEKPDASSGRWAELLAAAGHTVRWVEVRRADILEQLRGCDGFMWRWAHFRGMYQIARRLLPVLEQRLGLAVYPDWNTCWHYDDKIAQRYLLEAAGLPLPRTWVWFDAAAAGRWARTASYPLVLKLSSGVASNNVRLVRNPREAARWIHRLFGSGVFGLSPGASPWSWRTLRRVAAKKLLGAQPLPSVDQWHRNYVLFQEFLRDNSFDTRIVVIGHRAFGFRRSNRPGDFRASGSGLIDYTPGAIDERFVRLAFTTAAKLGTQSCGIDGLYRDGEPVIGEISYTYPIFRVRGCPGHWQLRGDPATGELAWHEGQMWPEEAQIQDFLLRLRDKEEGRWRQPTTGGNATPATP